MKSIKSILIAIAISFIGLIACESNIASDEIKLKESPQTLSEYLGEKIQKDFFGTAIDEDRKPLENVIVTIGNKTVITDILGGFVIKDVSVYSDFAYIEATKEGYKNTTISLDSTRTKNKVYISLEKVVEPCLFWFCKHNHSLPNSSN